MTLVSCAIFLLMRNPMSFDIAAASASDMGFLSSFVLVLLSGFFSPLLAFRRQRLARSKNRATAWLTRKKSNSASAIKKAEESRHVEVNSLIACISKRQR